MSEEQIDQERPCLHCMMVELIDDFFAEYPAPAGALGKVDTTEADEVIGAIAKTVAELTSQQDGTMRQLLIEHLMREIMNYDAEFRSEEATGSSGSIAPALAVFSRPFKAACASGIAVWGITAGKWANRHAPRQKAGWHLHQSHPNDAASARSA